MFLSPPLQVMVEHAQELFKDDLVTDLVLGPLLGFEPLLKEIFESVAFLNRFGAEPLTVSLQSDLKLPKNGSFHLDVFPCVFGIHSLSKGIRDKAQASKGHWLAVASLSNVVR